MRRIVFIERDPGVSPNFGVCRVRFDCDSGQPEAVYQCGDGVASFVVCLSDTGRLTGQSSFAFRFPCLSIAPRLKSHGAGHRGVGASPQGVVFWSQPALSGSICGSETGSAGGVPWRLRWNGPSRPARSSMR